MKRLLWGWATAVVAVFGEVACQSPAHPVETRRIRTLPPLARPAHTVGLSTEQINQAARLCTAKCARCHPLYDPTPYSDVEWRYWRNRMNKKAHLKPEEEELLWRYLGAFRMGAS